MSNSSTTAGYLTATGAGQAYDESLERELSQWVRALSGLPAKMVRPRWTPVQAAMPAAEENWCGFGIVGFTADSSPAFVRQSEDSSELWRHEVNARYYDINSLQIGKAAGTVSASNIIIAYNESATCSVANISITVSP